MYIVTLYYQFHPISDPEMFRRDQYEICRAFGLKGRIYIASEGINGTLAGPAEQIRGYQQHLRSISGFQTTAFKDDFCETIPFVKLIVKTRPEIVALKASVPVDPHRHPAPHLSPAEWRKELESGRPFTLLDVRNDYETRIGHFEGAILPPVENFFDFEDWLDQAGFPRDQKVLMYCTGGIRCEKFSVLMKAKGYKSVFQLDGGIINYAQKENGAHFKGKCFVFDDRLAVPIEPDQQKPLGACEITGVACDTYLNCANSACNKLFLCSTEGAKVYRGCCSETCLNGTRLRPFDQEHVYTPTRKRYAYPKQSLQN